MLLMQPNLPSLQGLSSTTEHSPKAPPLLTLFSITTPPTLTLLNKVHDGYPGSSEFQRQKAGVRQISEVPEPKGAPARLRCSPVCRQPFLLAAPGSVRD